MTKEGHGSVQALVLPKEAPESIEYRSMDLVAHPGTLGQIRFIDSQPVNVSLCAIGLLAFQNIKTHTTKLDLLY